MRYKKNAFGASYVKTGIAVLFIAFLLCYLLTPKEEFSDTAFRVFTLTYATIGFLVLLFILAVCERTILIDQDGVHEYWWRSNILHAEILWNDCAYIEVSTHYYGLQREICFSRLPLPPDGKIKKRAKDVIDMNATDEAVLNAVYAYVSPDRINFVTRANVR